VRWRARPDAFTPYLAGSLNNVSDRLAATGDREFGDVLGSNNDE
jgi:hypothetical protein